MEIPILVRQRLYIEMAPWLSLAMWAQVWADEMYVCTGAADVPIPLGIGTSSGAVQTMWGLLVAQGLNDNAHLTLDNKKWVFQWTCYLHDPAVSY